MTAAVDENSTYCILPMDGLRITMDRVYISRDYVAKCGDLLLAPRTLDIIVGLLVILLVLMLVTIVALVVYFKFFKYNHVVRRAKQQFGSELVRYIRDAQIRKPDTYERSDESE